MTPDEIQLVREGLHLLMCQARDTAEHLEEQTKTVEAPKLLGIAASVYRQREAKIRELTDRL